MSEAKGNITETVYFGPDRKGLRMLKGMQLIMLLGFFAVGLLVTGGVAYGIKSIPGIDARSSLLLSSACQCILAFCLSAWLTARLSMTDPLGWLRLKNMPSLRAISGVVIVYVLALPAMNQIISWNESISFPESLGGIEDSLRASEEAARTISETMLTGMSFGSMLAVIAVVGLLTGLSEEMFFRGGLQNSLTMPGRHAMGIWIAAIIFSAVHFQFFGFVPRVLMGAFFGYLLVWTGSLWTAAFAHALNNSVVVVSYYIMSSDSSFKNLDSLGVSDAGELPFAAIVSAAATAIFLWRFRRYFFTKPHIPNNSQPTTHN